MSNKINKYSKPISICLFLLLFFTNLIFAEPIPVSNIMATQTSVGYDAVNRMIDSWAKDYAKLATKDKSFITYVAELVQKKSVPGVRGPDGAIFITDGHHRSTAIARIIYGDIKDMPEAAQTVVSTARESVSSIKDMEKILQVNVNITAEYKTTEELVGALSKQKIGYFDQATRSALEGNLVKPANVYSKLPKLANLPDNPVRSAVGTAAYQLGLDSNNFKDYLEFYIGEKLPEAIKAKISSKTVNDPELLAEIKEFILSNNKILGADGKVKTVTEWLKSDMAKSGGKEAAEALKNIQEMPQKYATQHTITKKAGEQSKDEVLSSVRKLVCP